MPADGALVEVERLDNGRGADGSLLDHVGEDQVAGRAQVVVDGPRVRRRPAAPGG
ncbi:hypothetical protein [Nocardioides sp. B-3]|uniref:hypothetical protein n=1 Tax=Nocardioides sp. B-3 TaxID=2895565 RepID=UPI0021526DFF|nr:hypothetical protein [Nocardioides sp. B-3]UUZ60628.1 hypothetical protein LP418_07280 [Nocardioides sp. B-3]